jgi:hypothetical protein
MTILIKASSSTTTATTQQNSTSSSISITPSVASASSVLAKSDDPLKPPPPSTAAAYSRSNVVYVDEARLRQKRAEKEAAAASDEKRAAEMTAAKQAAQAIATKINNSMQQQTSDVQSSDAASNKSTSKTYRDSLLPSRNNNLSNALTSSQNAKLASAATKARVQGEPNREIIANILNSILTNVRKTDTSPPKSCSGEKKDSGEAMERRVAVTDGKAVKLPPGKTQRHIHVPKSAPVMPTKLLGSCAKVSEPPPPAPSTVSLSAQSNLSVTINNSRPATSFDLIWKMLENLLVNKFLRSKTGMKAIATKPEVAELTETNWSHLYSRFGKELPEFFLIACENDNVAAIAVIQAVKDMERFLADQSMIRLSAIKSEVETHEMSGAGGDAGGEVPLARIKRSASLEEGEMPRPVEKKPSLGGTLSHLEEGEPTKQPTSFICEIDLVSDISED